MLSTSHHLTLPSDEQPHDFAEEAGEQRVERRLRLEETVDLGQQCVLARQPVVDLRHVRRE